VDTKQIQDIWSAYRSVILGEKKDSKSDEDDKSSKKAPKTDKSDDGEGMDTVDKKELEKDCDDREDQDLDNDGDEDESDEYLHKRRRAVSKKMTKESKTWSVYKRIQERTMQPNSTGGKPESMDDKLTASDKKFLDAHGTDLNGIDSGINGAKAAADTANSIKKSSPSASPVRGDENRGRQ